MAERVLTRRDLNRALLARQLLLERQPLPLPRAVEQVGCLQTQYAPSAYIGLWTRLESFERDALTRALERRSLVQATLMRNTIHVVSRRDFWPLVLALREERKAWSRRVQGNDDREL
jgi:Winged helix DNA-binding domain